MCVVRVHNSPDRTLHSMKRMPDGTFERIDIEVSLDGIAAKLVAILKRGGLRGVASHHGSGIVGQTLAMASTHSFMDAIQFPCRSATKRSTSPENRWPRVCSECGRQAATGGSSTLVDYLRMGVETLCGHYRDGDFLAIGSWTSRLSGLDDNPKRCSGQRRMRDIPVHIRKIKTWGPLAQPAAGRHIVSTFDKETI